jgi:UDP-N-acetylglucosamine 2-epimerase (non-hydrolysing)/UDP-GlcNAc3NAcA epimerase
MPEELNRVLTDHASDLLLCSTETAVTNLRNEAVAGRVELVGDAMADVTLRFAPVAQERSTALRDHGVSPGEYVLVTAHRAGNVDVPDRLSQLVEILESLPIDAVLPLHPRTRARLEAAGSLERVQAIPGLRVSPPLGYLDTLELARNARAVLTDSGGLQKEAYLLETPCITMRPSTEWVETVDAGWNVLVDLDRDRVLAALDRSPPPERPELYGGGRAGDAIASALGFYTPK